MKELPELEGKSEPELREISKESFAVYSEYAKTFRIWMVSFGVGVPAFLLIESNEKTLDTIMKAPNFNLYAILFFTAVFLQIILALLNKNTNWFHHDTALRYEELKERRWSGFWRWFFQIFRSQYWIDICVDLTSLGCFITSTVGVLHILHLQQSNQTVCGCVRFFVVQFVS